MKGRKRFRYREGHGLGDPFWFILFLSFVAGLLMVCAGFSSCNKSVVVMMEGTITSASYTEMMDKNGAIYRVYDITIDNKTLFTLKESVKPGIQQSRIEPSAITCTFITTRRSSVQQRHQQIRLAVSPILPMQERMPLNGTRLPSTSASLAYSFLSRG